MTFEEWWAKWVSASERWNDAAGNYETIASEAWDYQQARIAELEAAMERQEEEIAHRGVVIESLERRLEIANQAVIRLRERSVANYKETSKWKEKQGEENE